MTEDLSQELYPETSALVGAAQSVWGGSDALITISIFVSIVLSDKLRELLDKDIESIFITDSGIRHIKKTHSHGEECRGQVDILPEDFAALPLILNEFDDVSKSNADKLGNSRLLFTKDIGDMAYVVTVSRGEKKLEIKTFWKRKMSGASC